ncbi:MAG: histidine kinase [Bacteroidetes bacterium]|nr:histidine kinase [Bacteroidota bacterium]MBS1756049.1 histidine kinase [Bacteroidota bacterium]
MINFAVIFLCLHFSFAQNIEPSLHQTFPPAYKTLHSDTARMRFLLKAISDSLDADRLSQVMNWARAGLAMAEKNQVDSMKGIFNFFIAKAFIYKFNKSDSAIAYYKKVLPYFPDRNRKYNAFSIREIMERYCELGNKDSSFVYLDSLRVFIDTMPLSAPKRVSLSQNIATVYQWFGMFKTAINYYQVAINGEKKNGNIRGLGLALANLGELYSESEDDVKAIWYSKEALSYLTDVHMPYMQTAGNLSVFYCNKKLFDSAFYYHRIADSMANMLQNTQEQMVLKTNLANIYLGQKKYDIAKPIFEENIITLLQTGDRWNLTKTYFSMAELDTCLQNFSSAKNYLLKGLTIATEDKAETLVTIALQNLSIICAKLGEYKNAYNYQCLFIQHKDSLTNEKTKQHLADLEISYKTLDKEQQIQLLQKDNSIKSLEISNNNRTKYLYAASLLFLVLLFSILFYQRSQRSKINTLKIKAELETQVLRAQMNPHFIFNSLNSIENFIMQNEKRLASDYLNKFARLIRMILDSSRNEVVPIAKDMETLQLYIDLEQLRFNNKFIYKPVIDRALLNGDYSVPSLLIQPYVENAIVHGLAHSENENLYLTITATLQQDVIKYVIQDNGIGRQQAAIYNLHNKPNHKSVGLQITEHRINNFNNRQYTNPISITDLTDENGKPCGTKVEIIIKAI